MSDQKLELELEDDNDTPTNVYKRSAYDRTFGHNFNEEEMLRIYIGPNADKFLKLYHKQKIKKNATGFNLAVLLFGFAWFFYRKMYLWGFCLLIIPISLSYLFPDIPSSAYSACHGAIGVVANILYLDKAKKQIKEISDLGLSHYETRKQIAQAGGVSRIGGTISFLIITLMFVLIFIGSTPPSLPQCDSRILQRQAKKVVKNELHKLGHSQQTIKVSDFKSIEYVADEYDICSFTVTVGKETHTAYAKSTWRNKDKLTFNTFVSNRLQELRQRH